MVDFDKLYRGSWYTISGCGGDIKEWKDGYQGLLDKECIGTITEWAEFTGAEMNAKYGLTGKNAYPSNFHFLAFPLDGLDVSRLAIFKLHMNDRWFDDIVDNNARGGISMKQLYPMVKEAEEEKSKVTAEADEEPDWKNGAPNYDKF